MALVLRHAGPRIIERGVATSLTADVYSAANAQQTATVATLTIKDGGETVIDAASATSLGPPASYSLLAATTTSRSLSDRWLEIWSMTISGSPYVFRRPAYLVRHAFFPTITDTDLTNRHAELDNLIGTNLDDFSTYREAAREKIERRLIKKGRRPHLIFDSWALFDLHLALTLHLIFRDWASSIGDGRYTQLTEEYRLEYEREWEALTFRFDDDEGGTIDHDVTESATPSLVLTAGPAVRRFHHHGYSR